jgi:hypothetical protein
MKHLVLAAALAAIATHASAQSTEITPPPRAELADGVPASTLLPALAQHSRHVARLENGRLTGEGADFLRALGAQSQFVLIGEDHGNEGIADFAAAYWRDLNDAGYDYFAIETDPWIAEALERELRAGGVAAWTHYAEANGGAIAAPFYTWTPEVRLAEAVIETSGARRHAALWGLDQVFVTSSGIALRQVAASARSRAARALASSLADQAEADRMAWLTHGETQPLLDLRRALNGRQDRDEAAAVDAIIQSQRIYRPFSVGGGEALLANIERENLMRQLFLENYRAAERADGAPPRVMLKFGSYHMYRGATPTHVQGLGGFVTEFAHTTGGNALSIATVCGPGGFVGTLDRPRIACDEGFAENFGFIAGQVEPDHITIFDLRIWKLRPGRWDHLPAEMRQFIDTYDVLVVVPGGAGSTFLPGLTVPQMPGN